MAELATAFASVLSQLVTLVPDIGREFVQWRELLNENPTQLEHLQKKIELYRLPLTEYILICTKVVSDVKYYHGNPLSAKCHVLESDLIALQEKLLQLEQECSTLKIVRKRDKLYPRRRRDKINALNKNLDELSNAVKDMEPVVQSLLYPGFASGVPQDHFTVVKTVPPNPPDICLDLDSKDENNLPLTYEGQLKHAIFDQSERGAVAAVARGIGGVGKSCALRAIGRLEETEHTFTGGILHMVIGADGGLSRLIESIADIVERAGGQKKSDQIRNKKSLEEATSLAGEWFERRPCLFLIDDIWCVNGITCESVHRLKDLAKHPRSRIAFTARDAKVWFEREIEFKERAPFGEQARSILLQCADLSNPTGTNACEAFNQILKTCNGLPVALSVCGRAVREYAKKRCVDHPEEAWTVYWELYKNRSMLSADRSDRGKRMKESVLLSLELIDKERNSRVSQRWFTALCILRKQQFVRSDVMQRMWGVVDSKVEDFISDLERFSIAQVRWSSGDQRTVIGLHDVLLEISRELALEAGAMGQWCKSLIVSYADMPNASTAHSEWQKALFEGFKEWWMEVEDDGYIFGNICWLLKHGQFYESLMWLICNPEWIVKQLGSNGDRQVVEDVKFCVSCLSKSMSGEAREGLAEFTTVLQRAVEMSAKQVHESRWNGMAWYQLYGRMVHLVKRNRYVGRFLEDVKARAPRPWLRPSAGCLPPAGEALQEVIEVQGFILCVEHVGEAVMSCYVNRSGVYVKRFMLEDRTEGVDVVLESVKKYPALERIIICGRFSASGEQLALGTKNGDILVCQVSTGGVQTWGSIRDCRTRNVSTDVSSRCGCYEIDEEGSHKSENESFSESENESCTGRASIFRCKCTHLHLQGHRQAVSYIQFSADGGQIASGSDDCAVRIWKRRGGEEWVSTELEGHEHKVNGVASSADGEQVVSASIDGTVRVWRQDGEEWLSTRLEGYEGKEYCVASSADGGQVILGSDDGTVRVWRQDKEGWVSTILEGHKREVNNVASSADGAHVVSGSSDRSVRIWERNEEGWVSTILEGHERRVNSVASSADGAQVVSGSWDRTVRVWGRGGEEWESTILEGHKGEVNSMAWSADGGQVISGSDDGTLRVWSWDGEEWVNKILEGHEGEVNSVTSSADGGQVVSSSNDGTVRVWRRDAGEWVSTKLKGHERKVKCVTSSADGRQVISDSDDGTVIVWSWDGKEWVSTPVQRHEGPVTDVARSAEGQRLMITTYSPFPRVWGWKDGKWSEEEDRQDHIWPKTVTRQDWQLDDTLLEEVVTPLLDYYRRDMGTYKTAFGYFILVSRPPFVVQIDVMWK